MVKKLFLLIAIAYLANLIESSSIQCEWSGDVCTKILSITPVTIANDMTVIYAKPLDYVNTATTDISLGFSMDSPTYVLNYVPTGIFSLFPNMKIYNTYNCSTNYLVTDAVNNCQNLETFQIFIGGITHIPYGFAQTCSKLSSIVLTSHQISTIDIDAFKGLKALKNLALNSNNIQCIPSGLFQTIPAIQSISLEDNKLTALDSNTFINLPQLSNLILSKNLLTYLPAFNLNGGVSTLLYTSVHTNNIYALQPDFFTILARNVTNYNGQVVFGNLSCATKRPFYFPSTSDYQSMLSDFQTCFDNWLPSMSAPVVCIQGTTLAPTTLPPTTAVVTTSSPTPGSCPSDKVCRYFLDQYNRYTCILDGVDSVLTSISGNHLITFVDSNVRRVIFTNSFLSRIPPILFQKFTSLEYLTVSNCSMSAINTNTFTACGNLKYFDASSNFITTVDGASFKSCAALEVIDLTGNKFDMISGQLFVNNPTLKAVYINRPPAMVLV